MSIVDQFDPAWQTVNIFVPFNAFKTFCFPHVTSIFSSVNVRKSCKYINFAVRSGLTDGRMERNNSESNMHFMIVVTVMGLLMDK